MNKSELLQKVARDGEERTLLARVLDKLEQADRGSPGWSPFLSSAQQEAVNRLIAAAGYPRHLWDGGFEDAERKVCAFLPDWQEEDDWEPPFTALRCTWKSGKKLTHRDFLGAILGQGLDREKVGDLLVGDGVCDAIVFQEVSPYLLQSWSEAGRAKLHVEEIPLSAVEPPVKTVKTVHDTVNTPRLDAVMSSGFSISRGKAAGLITTGKVELDHRPCLKPDRTVPQGAVITCRGLGKCVLKEINGLSKKGRMMIVLERYV